MSSQTPIEDKNVCKLFTLSKVLPWIHFYNEIQDTLTNKEEMTVRPQQLYKGPAIYK